MDDRSSGSSIGDTPIGDTIALLAQPAALLAGLVLAGSQFGRSYAMATLIARARQNGGYALLGPASLGAGIVIFAAFAAVHFLLSRKLGGPEDSEGEPGFGNWAALMFLYFLVSQLITFMVPLLMNASGIAFTNFPYILGSVSFVMRLAFFPIMVFLAAMTHDGEACSFGDIWSFVTTRAPVWFGGYVLLAIAVTFIPIGLMSALAPRPGNLESGGMLISSLVIALGQLLPILYAIAAYRAARGNSDNGPIAF